MPVKIDWNKLNLLPKDADKSFEEFCSHIVSHLYGQYGTLSYFYNTPGSEFYIELNKPVTIDGVDYVQGDVLGWQAKFWRGDHDDENSSLNASHIHELEEGFITTVKYKSNIKLWVVCTPGFFVQKQWDKLYAKLKGIKSDCCFTSWHRVKFEDFYLNDHHAFNGIFQYYFGESYAIKARLDEISKDTLSYLSKKFDVDIHTPTDFEDALLTIVNSDKAKEWLIDSIETLIHHITDDKKRPVVQTSTWEYKQFTPTYWELYAKDFTERESVADQLNGYLKDKDHILDNTIAIKTVIDTYSKERNKRVGEINKELHTTYKKHEKGQMLVGCINEMVSRVNSLEEYLTHIGEKEDISVLAIVNRIVQKDFSVFAEAGYGKTHFACSLASNMLDRDKPVFFVTGSKFRNCNCCESKLKDLLQLPDSDTVNDMLDALDFAGEVYECKLPIIIDGLNETTPQADRWREELPPLRRKIRERQHLILVTTCREKKDYITLIYGEDSYKKVENYIILPGIQHKNLYKATRLYFNKYDIRPTNQAALTSFTNPLLLKVFCEVNKGRHAFELNDHTLATCMSDYNRQLVDKIATDGGKVNKMKRHQIEEGLNKVAMIIWEKNDRQLDFFTEFANVFGDRTDDFLNEGMCFIVERVGDQDKVQFAFDLVAGFHIAKAIVNRNTDADSFCRYIEKYTVRLFGECHHTLAEDIAKSLFYLVPIYYQKQWYELMPNADVFNVAMDHLDIIASTHDGEESLVKLIESNKENSELKERLCNSLYERVCHHQNIRHISLFVPFFAELSALKADTWWNSKLAAKGGLSQVWSILHDRYWSNRYNVSDRMALSLLLCGVVDREYRSKFYDELFRLVEGNPIQGLKVCEEAIATNDYFIFEVIVSIVTGVGLRAKDEGTLKLCIGVLESYLSSNTSSHIVLIDDLETLYSYAEIVFGLEVDRTIIYKNKGEKWPVVEAGDYSFYPLYDYDFDKYYIRPLYEWSYHGDPYYSSEEVYGMLWARLRTKDYDEEKYAAIQNVEDKELNYRREMRVSYAHKLGRGVLMELYGWMMLNNKLDNEFKHTFRSTIVDIDPSHPRFYPKRALVSQSMLPHQISGLPSWIEQNHDDIAEGLFVTELPGHKGEWVLMRGYCTQKMEDRHANIYLSGTSQLVPEELSDEKAVELSLDDAIDYSSAFACELWWRPLEYTEHYDYDAIPPRLMARYEFSGWDSSQMHYSSFYMLNIKISQSIGLTFDMKTMAYYLGDEEVSAYFVNDEDMYFYIRRDVVDLILKKHEAKLRHHIYERRIVTGKPSKEIVELRDDQKFRQLDRDVFYHL